MESIDQHNLVPSPRLRTRGKIQTFQALLPESQGQNLALTVLYVPRSVDISHNSELERQGPEAHFKMDGIDQHLPPDLSDSVLTLRPASHTLHPYTLHPTPNTLHPTPPHPTPYALHTTPSTLHPQPYALNPTLETRNPKP